MSDPISEFREAMGRRGLIPPDAIIADGRLHRVAVEGKKGNNRSGAYILHADEPISGGFQNHTDGLGWQDWSATPDRIYSAEEQETQRRRIEAQRRDREADDTKRKKEAAQKARYIWQHAEPASPDHPYLIRKAVQANGVRQGKGNLIVPVCDTDGVLHSLQFIKPDGGKLFLPGGRKAGCFHLIGEVIDTLVIAEGYATAATIYDATGLPTAIAFDSGNLLPVVTALRTKYPSAKFFIGADDDWLAVRYVAGLPVRYNVGLFAAIEAARAVGGLVAVPLFGPAREPSQTDFNDQAAAMGANAVRIAIEGAQPPDAVAALLAQRAEGEASTVDPAATERGQGEVSGVAAPAAATTPEKPAKRPAAKRGSPFRMGKFGIEKKIETEDGDEWRWFCSPLEILAATRDGRGEDWGRLVKVTDMDSQARTWAMPMSMLAGDGSSYRERLLSMGLSIAPSKFARDALHEYLMTTRPDARLTCVSRVGWHGDIFVLPDRSYSAAGDAETGEGTVLQTAAALDHGFNVMGDAESWRREVAALAIGNSRLLLSISAAFAAPIVRLLGSEGGGVHFRGLSSTGKSTATEVAGSVWGGSSKGYARTWRATDNALEAVAAMHCDALLVLDEIAAVNPVAAAASAYMLSQGVGKQRASRNGDARSTFEWKVLFLSTGEISLGDKIAEDGKGGRAMAGQQARLIDLPADAGAGYGLFEELHGYGSGVAFANALKAASAAQHGHAAREFLTAITRDLAAVRETVGTVQKGFVETHCPPGADGQVLRVAGRFALIAAAGELAASLGIVPWPSGEAANGCARCFKDWIATRGGIEAQEDIDIVAHIRRFIEANATSRFERIGTYGETDELKTYAERTLNRVGFRKTRDDHTEYFIMRESWKSEVCRGFDHKHAEKVLLARGMLSPDSQGKPYRPQRLPGFPKLVRVVNLTSKLFDDDDDA